MKNKFLLLLLAASPVPAVNLFSQTPILTKQENIVYGMISGMALLMDVYQPEKANHKAIIYINGSAWGYPDDYQLVYNAVPLKDDYFLDKNYSGKWAQALVQKGYTVFVINHRFSPGYKFPDIFYDCQRAVRFIRSNAKKFDIDPAYIGAMGHSSGGNLAAMLGVTDTVIKKIESPIDSVSSKIQAVVTLAGMFNLADVDRNEDTAMARTFILKVLVSYMGDLPESNGPFILTGKYAKASPISYVTKDDAPMLIYYSDNDVLIPARQASAMYKKLNENAVPAKLVLRSGQGHIPEPGMEEVVGWFEKYLK